MRKWGWLIGMSALLLAACDAGQFTVPATPAAALPTALAELTSTAPAAEPTPRLGADDLPTVQVSSSVVNVRSGPSLLHPVITTVHQDDELGALGPRAPERMAVYGCAGAGGPARLDLQRSNHHAARAPGRPASAGIYRGRGR